MEQTPLFFEDIFDALRHLVQASGGSKVVGSMVFSQKEPEAAGRALMDCLNHSRPEKLDPEQLMLLLRLGNEKGCHVAIDYICRGSHYSTPDPINPSDERAELQKQFISSVTELQQLASRIGAL